METFMIIASPAVMVVVVKSVNVDDSISVPVDKESPLVLITFALVGIAVPDAIFQNLTVTVPVSPAPRAIDQSEPLGLPIVHPNGTVTVPELVAEAITFPPGAPIENNMACIVVLPGLLK